LTRRGNIYVVGETFGNFPHQHRVRSRTSFAAEPTFIIKISPAIAGPNPDQHHPVHLTNRGGVS
jgi:hypothetical protein